MPPGMQSSRGSKSKRFTSTTERRSCGGHNLRSAIKPPSYYAAEAYESPDEGREEHCEGERIIEANKDHPSVKQSVPQQGARKRKAGRKRRITHEESLGCTSDEELLDYSVRTSSKARRLCGRSSQEACDNGLPSTSFTLMDAEQDPDEQDIAAAIDKIMTDSSVESPELQPETANENLHIKEEPVDPEYGEMAEVAYPANQDTHASDSDGIKSENCGLDLSTKRNANRDSEDDDTNLRLQVEDLEKRLQREQYENWRMQLQLNGHIEEGKRLRQELKDKMEPLSEIWKEMQFLSTAFLAVSKKFRRIFGQEMGLPPGDQS